jgi:uncharacterized protein (PEP-CTERM system associated)
MTHRLRKSVRAGRALSSTICLSLLIGSAAMVGAASAQVIRVTPTFSVSEVLTDNRDLTQNGREADLITQISPGVTISSRSGALQGNLAYSLNGLVYARESSLNSVYHSLSSSGKYSILDGRAGLDATASAGRQSVSPFATQTNAQSLNSSNQAQVVSYSLSPYLSGQLLGDTAYQLRLSYTQSSSDATGAGNAGDTKSLTGTAGLNGRLGRIGWGLNVSRLATESAANDRTFNSRATGSLSFSPNYDWNVSLRAGSESDSIRTGSSQRTTTWGAGASWTPTPRTSVRIDMDRRFFGRSYTVSASHRMARTVWTFTDSRSLETSGSAGVSSLTNYAFYSQLFASITDAAVRDAVVRDFLASRNLDPNGREATAGFLTSGPTVQRSQNVSMAYQGLRATLTVSVFQTRSDSASQLSSGSTVQQRGFSASLSHRLTSAASVVVTASLQQTPSAGAQTGNDLKSIVATWSSKLGPHSNVSLGLRHTQADSDTNPYQESAIIGSIRMEF